MNKQVLLVLAMLLPIAASAASAPSEAPVHGPSLYRKHCSGCHQSVLKLKQAPDFVDIIRNPPSSMPAFSREKISDVEARAMSDYIRIRLSLKSSCGM